MLCAAAIARDAKSVGPRPVRLLPPPCGDGLLLWRPKWRLRRRQRPRRPRPRRRRPKRPSHGTWHFWASPSTSARPARPRSACVCTACRRCSPSSRLSASRPARTCSSAPCSTTIPRTANRRAATWRKRALFLLSKGMLLLMERKLQEVHPLLTLCGQIVENWQGNPIQKESLRVFFLVLQVTHYLDAGQVKSVKPCLKQLQQCIQTISTLHDDEILPSNPADLFHWLPKEHMCVLVYLVTVMHSMQAGYLEKAQKYTDKALMQLEKLKMLDCSPILSSFQVILLEHIIMCRLVTGHKATALQEISQVCQLCQQSPRLFSNHAAQLHTLLGLYCVSVNCMDNAEAQFTTALRLTNHQELWAFIVTNLASVYIREGNRHQEVLYSLLERINPDHSFPVSSHCLRAAAFYVRGLFSFFQGRYNEAKRFLRETLKMSNAEDLNRLTACSLVLLGHIFYVLGNHRESNNMVVPAMQLASKIPDMSVQLWSSALLRDLNKACGNAMDAHEAAQMHQNFSQQLLQDHIEACSLPEHNLITWTDGPPPVQFQAQNGPNTSLASLL
ncbi:MAU2 chromatid cohesion factor homolog isoform X6 [Myotis myotis]|uniref:MAU2 chromatid cohesion factor homolog isoform X6 n=1 Tax=Myotis myotis TaxID=51298 RepID=UPI00174AE608|nr:MAU2 chromatid cohesion factor homolog isoform X6 [Myotis myotis]